jgi:hypothetical protein
MSVIIPFKHSERALGGRSGERGAGRGVGQAYDGWREVSQFEFQQWVWEAVIHSSRLNDGSAPTPLKNSIFCRDHNS